MAQWELPKIQTAILAVLIFAPQQDENRGSLTSQISPAMRSEIHTSGEQTPPGVVAPSDANNPRKNNYKNNKNGYG